jgi:hypothetical protein
MLLDLGCREADVEVRSGEPGRATPGRKCNTMERSHRRDTVESDCPTVQGILLEQAESIQLEHLSQGFLDSELGRAIINRPHAIAFTYLHQRRQRCP